MKIKDIIRERLDPREVRAWTPQQWSTWLDSQLKAGQIAKADWTDAKQAIGRQVERAADQANQLYLQLDNVAREQFSDLYWAQPSGLHDLSKTEKVAQKTPDSAYTRAVLDLIASYKPLKNQLEQLKPLIVTATQQRDVAKQQQATQRQAEEGAASALVTALRANREQYVEEARRRALTFITGFKSKIESRGGLDAVAPLPTTEQRKQDPDAARQATDRRGRIAALLDQDSNEYADREATAAGESYDSWVYKLVQKIGKPVADAEVTGDPWTGSTITVTTRDGERTLEHADDHQQVKTRQAVQPIPHTASKMIGELRYLMNLMEMAPRLEKGEMPRDVLDDPVILPGVKTSDGVDRKHKPFGTIEVPGLFKIMMFIQNNRGTIIGIDEKEYLSRLNNVKVMFRAKLDPAFVLPSSVPLPNPIQIKSVAINEDYEDYDITSTVYKQLAKQGNTVISDYVQYEPAVALWKSLARNNGVYLIDVTTGYLPNNENPVLYDGSNYPDSLIWSRSSWGEDIVLALT